MGTEGMFENIEHLDKNTYRNLTTLSEHLRENQRKLSNRAEKVKVGSGHC